MPPNQQQAASTLSLLSWALYDWANSGFFAVIQTFVFAAYFVEAVAQDAITGSNLWGNVIGAAGIVIALCGPFLGAIADQTGRRKPWIFFFSAACIAATAALWFIKPDAGYVALALVLIFLSTVGSECALIFYNAMLPDLAPEQKIGRWSGWAWGLGYAGGLACLVIALFVFIDVEVAPFGLDPAFSEPIRATFILVALWYLIFSMPFFLKTPDSPRRPVSLVKALKEGWQQLKISFKNLKAYRFIFQFLIARMIFIDALATVFAFGGIYAAGTFDMETQEVLLFGIGLNITAGIGAVGFAWVDDWLGSRFTMILSLLGLIVLTSLLLLVTALSWFWVLGLALGLFVGPVQAASRTFMARIAPAHLKNQMFGLMALSGKVTAFVGPFLVGWLTYYSGSQRIGMSVIVVLFVIGFLVLLQVPNAGIIQSTRPQE